MDQRLHCVEGTINIAVAGTILRQELYSLLVRHLRRQARPFIPITVATSIATATKFA